MTYKYQDLRAYQQADKLTHSIFDTTSSNLRGEGAIAVNQIRRASLSVVLNIVEGNAKRLTSNIEFVRLLKIAYGSLTETEYLIEFCFKRKYFSLDQYNNLSTTCHKCGSQLWLLIKSQR